MKPKAPLERAIVLSILQYLTLKYPRWCWVRCEPPGALRARANRGRRGTAFKVPEDQWGDGVADILGITPLGSPKHGCGDTHSVAFEVKRPGQKQRPSQVAFQERWEKAGGLYAVVRSSEDAQASLTGWGL